MKKLIGTLGVRALLAMVIASLGLAGVIGSAAAAPGDPVDVSFTVGGGAPVVDGAVTVTFTDGENVANTWSGTGTVLGGVTVDGVGAAGGYNVTVDAAGYEPYTTAVNVSDVEQNGRAFAFDLVLAPAEPTAVPTETPANGTVTISKFYCDNIDSVEFITPDSTGTSDDTCVPGTATFTFYLVGDGTDAHEQLVVNEVGAIDLPAGDYTVVEEETQAETTITVVGGETSSLVVLNPANNVTPTPTNVAPTEVAPTQAPSTVTPAPTEAAGKVTALPSTGQGPTSSNSGTFLLLAAAGAMIAGAGAFLFRSKRA